MIVEVALDCVMIYSSRDQSSRSPQITRMTNCRCENDSLDGDLGVQQHTTNDNPLSCSTTAPLTRRTSTVPDCGAGSGVGSARIARSGRCCSRGVGAAEAEGDLMDDQGWKCECGYEIL